MSVDREERINDVPCMLCGHNLSLHLVMPIYENGLVKTLRVECKSADRFDYKKECMCNTGFGDVAVNITFNGIPR